jgi:hypothetical protein
MTFPTIPANGSAGYNLTRSLRFRASAGGYFNRTPASAGNRRTYTWSGWVKRGKLDGSEIRLFGASSGISPVTYNSFTNSTFEIGRFNGSTHDYKLVTSQVFRDPSAWYHFVISVDTTQATSTNRIRFYVNGTQVTAFSTATYPSQNFDTDINNTVPQYLGLTSSNASDYFDGYLAEVNFIDGQALTPSSFGSTNALTGVWQPARYTGTYGTNGFYLKFTDNSTAAALGTDFSGNSNTWTTNNISVTAGVTYDSMTDVPTLTSATAANYCVLNPLWKGANITLSAANLNASMSATSDASFSSTITITSGKWYWESVITSPSTDYPYIGVATPNFNYQAVGGSCIRSSATGFFKASNATKWNLSSSAYGSSFVANDVMMIAYDADGGKIYFGKNGTWDASSDPAAGTSPAFTGVNAPVTPAGFVYNCSWIMNFGQRPFAYTPPTGFVALNTYNLPTSTIVNGSKEMGILLYTGDGTTSKAVTGLSFQPDLTYVKNRSAASDPTFSDTLRGITKVLYTDATSAESTAPSFGYINSILSTGFNVNSGGGTEANFNKSGQNYVGWTWKAGQGSSSSNTNGTITSTVSVNASAGLSMVTYTANGTTGTIGHSLGVTPQFIVVKARSSVQRWTVFHVSTSDAYIYLNETFAASTGNAQLRFGNNTSVVQPTSSVFTIGNSVDVNSSGNTYVAYCWTPIAGYSAFGSYTGNGSTDGPFVYLGFRPRWVMVKATSAVENWPITDSARSPFNAANAFVRADESAAETTGAMIMDFNSNGFKMRTTDSKSNGSGVTYIYMAFAENPFKNALAR